MTSLASVRAFAQRVGDTPVHVLVNNAGVMQRQREVTEDGYEVSWQVNALSPFLLTRLLLPNLRRASEAAGGGPGSARVLYLGSMLDKGGDLSDLNNIPDFLSLQRFASSKDVKPFKPFDVYATSKMAGTLLHLELANRLRADASSAGLAINAVSPGMVNTELNRHLLPWPLPYVLSFPLALILRSPAQGAACPLALASDGAAKWTTTGSYFRDGQSIDRRDSLPLDDTALLHKLWSTTEDMMA